MLIRFVTVAFIAMLFSTSVDTSLAGSGPGPGHGPDGANGPVPGGNGQLEPLTGAEEADLLFMREEEKLARDSYAAFADEFKMLIFSNISRSEQIHMDAVKRMIDKYGLDDPVEAKPEPGEFVNDDLQTLYDDLVARGLVTYKEALKIGAEIEEVDIIDLVDAIALVSPDHDDIIKTYGILLCGAYNHLRAFVKNIELDGVPYSPVFLNPLDLDAIVDAPMERDCGDGDGKQSKKRNSKGPGTGN